MIAHYHKTGQRRTHICLFSLVDLAQRGVGILDGLSHQRDVAFLVALFCCLAFLLGIKRREEKFVDAMLGDSVDYHAARKLSIGVSAHAIGDDEDANRRRYRLMYALEL